MILESPIKLMLITASPEKAREAVAAGVDRIFVDLEILGKKERQAGRSTVISGHSLEDAKAVRKAIGSASLLVRLNPLHSGTPEEVEGAIEVGADLLMLPMFRSPHEVETFCGSVSGRAAVVALVETREAVDAINQVVRVPGLSEVYLGLNDLSLSMGMAFMFEPLASGVVDGVAAVTRGAGLPFGFGGIARIGGGSLPAELILGEHLRVGSSRVILSRAFHEVPDLKLGEEVVSLREAESRLWRRTPEEVERDRTRSQEIIERLARESRSCPK